MDQKTVQQFTNAVVRLSAVAEQLEKFATTQQFSRLQQSVERLTEQVKDAQASQAVY